MFLTLIQDQIAKNMNKEKDMWLINFLQLATQYTYGKCYFEVHQCSRDQMNTKFNINLKGDSLVTMTVDKMKLFYKRQCFSTKAKKKRINPPHTLLSVQKKKRQKYCCRPANLKGHLHSPPLDFLLHKPKKKQVFSMSPLAAFEKIRQFFKFLVLRARMRIYKNARLQAFVQKTWQNLI